MGRRRPQRGDTGSESRRTRRQRRRNRRAAADAYGEALRDGLAEIARLCSALALGETVRELASALFRRARDRRLLYGRGLEPVAAATVYVGARNTGAVRSLEEIAATSRVAPGRVRRSIRHVQRELDLPVRPVSPAEYLPKLRSTLDLDSTVERRSRELLEAAVETAIHSGRDPRGLAGGAVYTVMVVDGASTGVSQRAVGEAAGVTPETIRTRFRELKQLCPAVFDVAEPDLEPRANRPGLQVDDATGPAD